MKRFFLFLGIVFFSHQFLIAQDLAKKETTSHKSANESLLGVTETDADFPGGMDSLIKFIQYHFEFPEKAIMENIEGQVIVQFEIGTNGQVSNVRMAKSLENCPECNEAAMNVVKKLPRWTPYKVNGKPVFSTMNLPISLELEGEESKE
jgi:protein TonB